MTLIIAGYDYKENSFEALLSDKSELEICGIFAHADSAITSGSGKEKKILLTEFRKLYQLKVNLWKPHFDSQGAFLDYREIHLTQEMVIGFAGSTLTAQHILNFIFNHITKLRISHGGRDKSNAVIYQVQRHCDPNPLSEKAGEEFWEECTFTDRDFANLLTGDVVSDCIEHAINKALASAAQYKWGNEFIEMKTDLFSAFWCAQKKRYELYVYRMKFEENPEGFSYPCTKRELVAENCVAVLGMENDFAKNAQNRYDEALTKAILPRVEMHKFLECAIKEVKSNGGNAISEPIFTKLLNQYGVTQR